MAPPVAERSKTIVVAAVLLARACLRAPPGEWRLLTIALIPDEMALLQGPRLPAQAGRAAPARHAAVLPLPLHRQPPSPTTRPHHRRVATRAALESLQPALEQLDVLQPVLASAIELVTEDIQNIASGSPQLDGVARLLVRAQHGPLRGLH